MGVIRTDKTENYTVIGNYHLQDKRLSLKAKGFLTLVLSLPKEWNYTVNGLVSICKENKTAIQSVIKELEENGYLTRTKTQDENGRFDYDYLFHEKSEQYTYKPQVELPQTENLVTVNPCTDNQPQLNTNIENTDILNTNNTLSNDMDEIIQAYSDICGSLPKIAKITEQRKKKVKARLKAFSKDDIIGAFVVAEQSDFLTGKVTTWKANFDWIMANDNNLLKILEGNYSHKKKTDIDELNDIYQELGRRIKDE